MPDDLTHAPHPAFQPGSLICAGKYRLVRELGAGSFGVVWLAEETNSGNTQVAIKISRENEEAAARFNREVSISRMLDAHPNVLNAETSEQEGGSLMLVMRYMPGGSLQQRLKIKKPLPVEEALSIAAQVANGLAYLHEQDIIHRDLHPGNILFNAKNVPRIADLGIAQSAQFSGSAWYGLKTGQHPGNIFYHPPEATGRGEAPLLPLMPAADVYMLGAVLWEMLTGRQYYYKKGTRPSELNRALPAWLDELVMGMLAEKPDERPRDGAQVARMLNGALERLKRERQQQLQGTLKHLSPNPFPPASGQTPSGKGSTRSSPPGKGDILLSPIGERQGVRSAARPFAWKWLGLGAGLLVGLALLIGVASLAIQAANDSRATQTAQARINLTADALAALPSLTPEPTPLSPSPTPLPPSLTPTHLPPTSTPTPLPPSPTPTLAPGATQTSPMDGMVLSYIPAGTFQMGEDANRGLEQCQLLYEPFTARTCLRDWFTNEEPVHTVSLDAFWIDQSEVTNAMYARCVAAGACSPPINIGSYARNIYYGDASYADYPVIYVDWTQADAYCTWTGRKLPTEAQWEYAARGGLAGALYPWGDVFNGSLGNFCDANCTVEHSNPNFNDGYIDTAPVGSYPANGYGLYDMAGNVWEWVADWYGYYSSEAVESPTGPATGQYPVSRGGSWDNSGSDLRVSDRNWYSPDKSVYHLGFRCAYSP